MRRIHFTTALIGLILIGSVLAGYAILMSSLLGQWDPTDEGYSLARFFLFAILLLMGSVGFLLQIRLVQGMLWRPKEEESTRPTRPLSSPAPLATIPTAVAEQAIESTPTVDPLITNLTFGRYRIQRQLGVGGMGIVYLALDPSFDRCVAIKVLPAHLCANAVSRERFRREAFAIAALEHTAAVPVYDFGEEAGQPFLVMRYLSGGSLQDLLQSAPPPLLASVEILRRIIPALARAHSLGMIHRDIKPGNILFDQERNPYLTDFGLVKMLESDENLSRSEFFGTPVYASPEQCSGELELDHRTDIYSLTAMFFRMITGFAPYSGSSRVVMAKHMHDPIPRLSEYCSDIPVGLQVLIDRGMAKNPRERYASVTEVSIMLDDIFPRGAYPPAAY